MPPAPRPPPQESAITAAQAAPATPRRSIARKVWLLVCAGVLTACGSSDDSAFAARVDSWELTRSELAELLVLAQPYPVEAGAAEDLARHWMGVAALARRLAAGDSLTGEEAVRQSTWLERREAYLAADRERRLGPLPALDAEAEYREGTLRLLAHVLRRVGPETSDAERDLQRRTAERILSRLIEGGSWDAAVAESEDATTSASSGLLGLVGPGELPPGLDGVAFRLEPGQVSSVIQTPAGFHILYRPRFADVGTLFESRLRERRLLEADAASTEEILPLRRLVVPPHAAASLRTMAAAPLAHLDSGEEVASWEGGTLTLGTVARFVTALPAGSREEMMEAPDAALRTFVRDVAVQELRILDGTARGLTLAPDVVSGLREQHAEEVRGWMDALGAAGDGSLGEEGLRRYMRNVVSRQAEARSLPPLFEAWLLGRVSWSLSEVGIEDAVTEARGMLQGVGEQDSSTGAR